MIIQWKDYPIHLGEFNKFLKANVPHADGIVTYDEHFVIIEKIQFTQSDINVINVYYNSLDPDVEAQKLSRPARLAAAYQACKESLVTKSIDALTELEKKVLLNLVLTESEQEDIITIYG